MRISALLLSLLFSSTAFASDPEPYFSIGAAYKVSETKITGFGGYNINNADTAQFELGIDQGNWSYGFRHVSNWSVGPPINNEDEYVKNEIFVEYKIKLDWK